jgi:hypothetical protein
MALRGGAATAAKLECGVVGVLCPVKPVEIDQSVEIRSFYYGCASRRLDVRFV